MKANVSQRSSRAARMAVALLGLGLSLGGCVHDEPVGNLTAGIPDDYRLRRWDTLAFIVLKSLVPPQSVIKP